MPYNVNRYNGVLQTTVPDQTVDTSSTDLRFVGKNYAGYGEILNENFLHLLESFRGDTQPRKSIPGQVWYDDLNNKIKFRSSDNQWRTLAVADVSTTPPTGLQARDKGNIWYDETKGQISIWNGTDFELIGPERSTGFGETKLTSVVIRDDSNIAHGIVKIVIDDTVIGTISNDEFIIGTIENIPGFTTIKKGITLVDTPVSGVTTGDHRFWGTASDTLKFTGLDITNFVLRAPGGSTYDDAGLTVGIDGDLRIAVDNGNEAIIENSLGNTLRIRVKNGNVNDDISVFSNVGMLPGEHERFNIGGTNEAYREVHTRELYATSIEGTLNGNVVSDSGLTMINKLTDELNGLLIGDLKGNILDSANNYVYEASTKTFTGTNATITNLNSDSITLVNRLTGDVQGDIYAADASLGYNNNTKDWYGTFNGNADTATRLAGTPQINGVVFDGSQNVTISDSTKVSKTGDTMVGNLTITATPTLNDHAATVLYVNTAIRSRTIFFSLDTRGLNETSSGPGSVAYMLNTLAPVSNFEPGTRANVASTRQNVTSSVSAPRSNWIGRSFVTSVSVTTTVNDPTRNNNLIYEVNQAGNSWVYVSG
jgi:hypothetical protein